MRRTLHGIFRKEIAILQDLIERIQVVLIGRTIGRIGGGFDFNMDYVSKIMVWIDFAFAAIANVLNHDESHAKKRRTR